VGADGKPDTSPPGLALQLTLFPTELKLRVTELVA
jgi:hypothetical protein